MSVDVLLLMAVLGVLVVFTARAVNRVEARGPSVPDDPIEAALGDDSLDRVLWKINRTIQILQENLPADKLTRGRPAYVDFYLAYLLAFAETVCEVEDVEFTGAVETPVLLEVIRLGGPGHPTSAGSGALLSDILATAPGRRGREAGRMDAIEACEPGGRGPYFTRIRGYFESQPAAGER